MKEKFSKSKLLGATRQILTEVAAWTDTLYAIGSAERLIGVAPGRDPEWDDSGVPCSIERVAAVKPRDWSVSGSAGAIIEQSPVLNCMAKVVDNLNTNTWQGDVHDYWNTYLLLNPLHFLLEGNWHERGGDQKIALSYAIDNAIDPVVAKDLYQALNAFFARVRFECDRTEITISDLAAISGLAEKTVRMAALGQDKNPDLVTFKDGRMTFVTIEEARRWLASKNVDYKPTQFASEKSLPPIEPTSLVELGAYLLRMRESRKLNDKKLAALLHWQKAKMQAYRKLEDGFVDEDLNQFSTEDLVRLAKAILPAESDELVRIMDKVIHPIQLEFQIQSGME